MLILMDTAISLLNVNEPVYPLDIVKNMRDQRPCMVQNVVSSFSSIHSIEYSQLSTILLIANQRGSLFEEVKLGLEHKTLDLPNISSFKNWYISFKLTVLCLLIIFSSNTSSYVNAYLPNMPN